MAKKPETKAKSYLSLLKEKHANEDDMAKVKQNPEFFRKLNSKRNTYQERLENEKANADPLFRD